MRMTGTKRDSNDSPIGVGPGITGASGDFISSTGQDEGLGGTGHEADSDVSGARPDERQNTSPEELIGSDGDQDIDGDKADPAGRQ
jgi:hypothetical protein